MAVWVRKPDGDLVNFKGALEVNAQAKPDKGTVEVSVSFIDRTTSLGEFKTEVEAQVYMLEIRRKLCEAR